MYILQQDYDQKVRGLLGVEELDLPYEVLNSEMYEELAEAIIMSRAPDYDSIEEDSSEGIFLRMATIYLVCSLVCPYLKVKLNIKVKTMDTSWEKQKVDWDKQAENFLEKSEEMLGRITSIDITTVDSIALADYVRNTREPIGGE